MKKYIRQIKEKLVQSFHGLSGCVISNNIHVVRCLDFPDAVLLDFYGYFIAHILTTCRNVIGHSLIKCLMDEWGTHQDLSTQMPEPLYVACLPQDIRSGGFITPD
jgi:hypothetical protein